MCAFRVQELCRNVATVLLNMEARHSAAVPVEKKVQMAVWTLANQDTFRSIGNLFGLSRGGAHWSIFQVCKAICSLKSQYVKWPTTEDYSVTASAFERKHGIPNVVGCIDGTHIPVKAPANDRDSYVNRKGYTSINVLAVCDESMRFTYVYADRAGSVHDARVLRVSSLGQDLVSSSFLQGGKYHLLGDSAYPLLPTVLVPYRDNGHLTHEQRRFNTIHSSARSMVERAFGRLKGKFRRLRGIDATCLQNALLLIEASFVLHNFILDHDEDSESYECEVGDDEVSCGHDDATAGSSLKQVAQAKRDQIASML